MNKAEFIDLVARDQRIESRQAATDAVEAVLDGIGEVLGSGDEVGFTGFGKFSVSERGERQGVNPRTGERITIAASRAPKFSAGAGLKSRVKGG